MSCKTSSPPLQVHQTAVATDRPTATQKPKNYIKNDEKIFDFRQKSLQISFYFFGKKIFGSLSLMLNMFLFLFFSDYAFMLHLPENQWHYRIHDVRS